MSIYRDANPTHHPYSVTEHGSHPDLSNDNCWTSTGYATLDEARAAFYAPATGESTTFVMLEGSDGTCVVRANPTIG